MYRACIAVVDASRARLLTFERTADGAGIQGQLTERVELVEPGRGVSADQLARTTMAALRELVDEQPTQRVVLCASPRMLGRLRAAAPGLLPTDVALSELPRDLSPLSTGDLRATLESRDLLMRGDPLHS